MNGQRVGRYAGYLAMLAYLLLQGGGAGGFVWCFASDGRVSMEASADGRCVSLATADAQAATPGPSGITPAPRPDCGECVDLPAHAGCADRPAAANAWRIRPDRTMPFPLPVPPQAASAVPTHVDLTERAPPLSVPTLSNLRTVILVV